MNLKLSSAMSRLCAVLLKVPAARKIQKTKLSSDISIRIWMKINTFWWNNSFLLSLVSLHHKRSFRINVPLPISFVLSWSWLKNLPRKIQRYTRRINWKNKQRYWSQLDSSLTFEHASSFQDVSWSGLVVPQPNFQPQIYVFSSAFPT